MADEDLTIRARLVDDISGPARKAKESIREIGDAAKKAGRDQVAASRSASSAYDRTMRSVRGAGSALGLLARMSSKAGAAGIGAGRALASAFGSMATSAIHKAGNAIEYVSKRLALLGAGTAAFGIKMAGNLEQTNIAFEVLLGSQAKAATLLSEMNEFAKVTPYRFADVADSAKLLLAAGWSQNQIIPTLRKIGDASSAVSVPIDRVLQQITQMKSAESISWVDMRVLSQTGLPVLDILGKKLGKTSKQIKDMMSDPGGGAALFQMGGLDALVDGLGERFGGMMDKQSRTLLGRWSTVLDTVTMGLGKMFTPINNMVFKPLLEKMAPKLDTLFRRGESFARAMGQGFANGRSGGKGLLGGIRGALAGLDQQTGGNFDFGAKFEKALPSIRNIIGAIPKIGRALLTAARWAWRLGNMLWDAGAKARRLWNATRGFREQLARISANVFGRIKRGAEALWKVFQDLRRDTQGIRRAIGGITQATFRGVARAARSAWSWIKQAWDKVTGFIGAVARISQGPIRGVARAFASVGNMVRAAIRLIGDLIAKIRAIPSIKIPGLGSLGKVAGNLAAPGLGALTGDTPGGPRVRASGSDVFARTSMLHGAIGGSGIRVTSGLRNHDLGSFNSAHKAGNALDLIGSGLNRYASRLTEAGGYAAFHGTGAGRHLHAEYPVGDTTAPRVRPSSGGGGNVTYGGDTFLINGSGLSRAELEAVIASTVDRRDRGRRERAGGRR